MSAAFLAGISTTALSIAPGDAAADFCGCRGDETDARGSSLGRWCHFSSWAA